MRIERVPANPLENAANDSLAGAGITTGAAPVHANAEGVAVWAADAGPGLPPGREELTFAKFERGHRESATPGVELGLAICQAIVAAQGGSLRGETRPQARRASGSRCRAANRCRSTTASTKIAS